MNDDAPAAGDGAAPEPAQPASEPADGLPGDPAEIDGSTPAAALDAAAGEATGEATGGLPGRTSRLGRVNPVRLAGYVAAAAVGALVMGGLFVALGAANGSTASPSPASTARPTPAVSGAAATAAPSGEASRSIPVEGSAVGSPTAPVTIEIWSDFQCPYCSLLAHAIEPDLIRGPVARGEVRLVYRDYVFLGQESLDAAVAARCAGRQGAFWRYHDLLFATQQGENQGTFSQQFLSNIAGFAELDPAQFLQCVGDASVAAGVLADTKQGGEAGVESTPTLIITGPVATRTVRGFPSWADLLLEIDRSTGRAPIPSPAPTGAPTTPGMTVEPSGAAPSPAPSADAPESASPEATATH